MPEVGDVTTMGVTNGGVQLVSLALIVKVNMLWGRSVNGENYQVPSSLLSSGGCGRYKHHRHLTPGLRILMNSSVFGCIL